MIRLRKPRSTRRHQDPGTPSGFCSLQDPDQVDQAILTALLFEPASGPWSTNELVLEIRKSPIEIDDSLWRLSRTGVVHRLADGFVFVSRAAAHTSALLDPHSEPGSWPRATTGRATRGELTP